MATPKNRLAPAEARHGSTFSAPLQHPASKEEESSDSGAGSKGQIARMGHDAVLFSGPCDDQSASQGRQERGGRAAALAEVVRRAGDELDQLRVLPRPRTYRHSDLSLPTLPFTREDDS